MQEYEFHHLGNMRCGVSYQTERDERIRQTLITGDWDAMDEELFRGVWGNELDIFAHDAAESVEEWMISRGQGASGSCEVVVTNTDFRDSPL